MFRFDLGTLRAEIVSTHGNTLEAEISVAGERPSTLGRIELWIDPHGKLWGSPDGWEHSPHLEADPVVQRIIDLVQHELHKLQEPGELRPPHPRGRESVLRLFGLEGRRDG